MFLRVLLDSSNLHNGGGVQVAASFISELYRANPSWLDYATVRASTEVAANLSPEARQKAVIVDENWRERARRLTGPRYDVAFRIFGPHYGVREAEKEIAGFADPFLPPSWPPADLIPQGWKHKLKYRVKRIRSRAYDQSWVESDAYRRALTRDKIGPEHVTVVANAASEQVIGNLNVPDKINKKSAPPQSGENRGQTSEEVIRLLYPARPYPHKNHAALPEALRLLQYRGFKVELELTLTKPECDCLLGELGRVAKPLGVLTQAELAQAYRRADLVLFPTLLEVSSATPLEAIALGKPLVASNREFIREQVGDAAWYIEPTKPQSIAAGIIAAMSDSQTRKSKILTGLEIARNSPTPTHRVNAFVTLIENATPVRKRHPRLRVMVAHPVQQHSMRTAWAVKSSGAQLLYCTPVYDRPGSLTNSIKPFLSRHASAKASRRKSEGLTDNEVVQKAELVALVLLGLQRIPLTRAPFHWWRFVLEVVFGAKAAKLAKNSDIFIAYDTFAKTSLKLLARYNPEVIRVIDMSAASAPYVDDLLQNISKSSAGDVLMKNALPNTRRMLHHKIKLRRAKEEIKLADHFLVASQFTARSLTQLGVPERKIHICRYGAPELLHMQERIAKHEDATLRVIYVGNATAQKGITTYLSAAEKSKNYSIEFTAVGQIPPEFNFVKENARVSFVGYLPKESLYKQLLSSHVMVFPSLADGFGLSALEAMAAGCTVICSRNAGISDLIEDGVNGLLFDAGDARMLARQLQLLDANRELLAQLSAEGRRTAASQTWASYHADVAKALSEICDERTTREK
jgi:glycosyltransferase involved in cell wall biosynthesis